MNQNQLDFYAEGHADATKLGLKAAVANIPNVLAKYRRESHPYVKGYAAALFVLRYPNGLG